MAVKGLNNNRLGLLRFYLLFMYVSICIIQLYHCSSLKLGSGSMEWNILAHGELKNCSTETNLKLILQLLTMSIIIFKIFSTHFLSTFSCSQYRYSTNNSKPDTMWEVQS